MRSLICDIPLQVRLFLLNQFQQILLYTKQIFLFIKMEMESYKLR